jgi:hypothetical protein
MTTTSPSETPYEHVMLDIETMSLHPHKALILSIGMIEFDPAPLKQLFVGKRSLLVLDIPAQLALGRRVDVSTQEFWAKQPYEASRHWVDADEHHSPHEAIGLVQKFCEGRTRVWANGTQFDLSNIIGLAEDIGISKDNMWHYQAPRDMRTFCRETPAMRLVPIGDALDIPGVAHEPVYDCIVQAWQVWAHWQSPS